MSQKNILFCIGHPAQVHLFKNAIQELEERGHSVHIIARPKEDAIELLKTYEFDYKLNISRKPGYLGMVLETMVKEFYTPILAKRFNPDVIVSNVSMSTAHTAFMLRKPHLVFNDIEESHFPTVYPLAKRIYTPHFFKKELGDNHSRYDGYHELAYLHPNWFRPDKASLKAVNVEPDEPFVVLRFVAMDAYHDRGEHGISDDMKVELVNYFAKHGDVFISNEGSIPHSIRDYKLSIPPHLFHDLLFYADVCIGDSQAVAAEAAIMGTPTVRSNSFCEGHDITKFRELETEFGLLRSTPNENHAFEIAKDMFANPNIKKDLAKNRQKMLEEKIDLTNYMVREILDCAEKGR